MKYFVQLLVSVAVASPSFALAAPGELTQVQTFLENFILFVNQSIVPLVFAIAFIFFIWGIFTYFIKGSDDEENRKKGGKLMLWGIIGFVVMVSVWGIVNLLAEGLSLNQSEIQNIPGAPVSNN
jgi:hypothetical protein